MDNTKLNELAAKAMGWTFVAYAPHGFASSLWDKGGGKVSIPGDWNPAECADDALVLLEKIAEGNEWHFGATQGQKYGAQIRRNKSDRKIISALAETPSLAMTLCALRAAGISETEIADALK